MVGRSVPPELDMSYAQQYIADVKKAFNEEPKKYREFAKILDYITHHREHAAICFARVKELMEHHPDLLLRFNDFLRPDAKRTIPPEAKKTITSEAIIVPEAKGTIPLDANKGLGEVQTMVGRRAPGELTMEDAHPFVAAVKEGFRDEPGKYIEFLNILNDYSDHRTGCTSTVARVKELMKEHPKLLLGFNLFIPDKAKITNSLKAKRIILKTKRSVPDQEAKTIIILNAKGSVPTEAKTTIIFKKRTVPTEADEHHHGVYTKRRRVESDHGASFIDKLKTRFRSLDTHVVKSFHEIMKTFEEGTMSKYEVHEEVVDLLYYHEDLIDEFPRYFKRKKIIYE